MEDVRKFLDEQDRKTDEERYENERQEITKLREQREAASNEQRADNAKRDWSNLDDVELSKAFYEDFGSSLGF